MSGYGKVYRLGMREVSGILDREVYVEEKVDGSQFSFGVDLDGNLWCASRSKLLDLNSPDNLFFGAVQTAKRLYEEGHLDPGTVYRGEAMRAPRHNKQTYERVPKGNLALFDAGDQTRESLEAFAQATELECVPVLGQGKFTTSQLEELVSGPSFLGGTREGIVIKQPGGLKAKIVCESFRESKPKRKGPIGVESIVEQYRTEARWDKAIQHLTEAGELANTPKDIPKVMREIHRDLSEECEAEIRAALWPKIWKEIVRGVSQGAAEHYLGKLGKE